jgi:hypothetical protein
VNRKNRGLRQALPGLPDSLQVLRQPAAGIESGSRDYSQRREHHAGGNPFKSKH